MNSSTLKNLFLWMAILLVAILLWNTLQAGQGQPEEIPYSEFVTALEAGHVAEVTITDQSELSGKYRGPAGDQSDNPAFETVLPFVSDSEFTSRLEAAGVEMTAERNETSPLFAILLTWAPVLLLVGLWIFFMRQMQSGGNRALSFGKSKAKLLNTSGKKVTFKDVSKPGSTGTARA